jgi:predicted RNA-binding protein YlqC (UPF0109 family)
MFKNFFSSNAAAVVSGDTKDLNELVENMVKALVDEPNSIDLKRNDSDEVVIFELRVSKNDLGKVIGKKGRTASAMRTILSAASRKHKLSADLRIVE